MLVIIKPADNKLGMCILHFLNHDFEILFAAMLVTTWKQKYNN